MPRVQGRQVHQRMPGGDRHPGLHRSCRGWRFRGRGGGAAPRQRVARDFRPRLPAGKAVRSASASAARSGEPVAIGYLERFVADWAANAADRIVPSAGASAGTKSRSSAAGPAGLTARASSRSAGTMSRSSKPCTSPAASWSTASPNSACPSRSSKRSRRADASSA